MSLLHEHPRYVERVLHLPQGTLASWNVAGCPPEGVALLRLVELFPWLLDVAEAHYDRHTSRRVLTLAALGPYPMRTALWTGPTRQAAWASWIPWRPVVKTLPRRS